MARNTAMPSGYDYEFVEEVSEDYICVICQLAMRNPVQTSCGHLFCRECLDEAYKMNPNECPFDRRRLAPQDILPHPFAERKILSLNIKCLHRGCDWQGELRDIESHESRCEYKVVDCDNENCTVRKPRREMVRHVQEGCQYRMVPCPHCKNTYTFCLLEEHTSACPKCPVSCPNVCGKTMKREEVLSHLTDDCPLTIVPCSYQNIGCSFEVQRKYLNDHIDNHVKQHISIAVEKIVSLQKQMNDNEKTATLTNERNQNQMDEMCKRFQTQLDDIKKQVPPTIQDILKRIPPNSPIMTKEDKGYSYVWKITGLNECETLTKKMLFNTPFHTHKHGYNLRLQLQMESYNMKCWCVLVKLMLTKGMYDEELIWPFPLNTCKFILLDWNPIAFQLRHIEKRAVIINGKYSWLSGRPNDKYNISLASCNFFVDKTLYKGSYAIDDTVFLKLEILQNAS